jgi:hypothetical protein
MASHVDMSERQYCPVLEYILCPKAINEAFGLSLLANPLARGVSFVIVS